MKLALAHYPVRTLLMLLVLVVVLPLAVTAFVQSYVYSRALIAEKQANAMSWACMSVGKPL